MGYDMHGNLYEWCLDWWSSADDYRATFAEGYAAGAVTVEPPGPVLTPEPENHRVRRGGNHFYEPGTGRSASRDHRASDNNTYHNGCRLVCEISVE